MENTLYVFPDYYSSEVKLSIIHHGKEQSYDVYRVGKYGKDKSNAFLNYYDEVVLGYKIVRNRDRQLKKYAQSIDSLSISCYKDFKDIIYYYNITLKDSYPERILFKGRTLPTYGLSQLTIERKPDKKDSHVDWWLFLKATPWDEFEEVLNDERNIF